MSSSSRIAVLRVSVFPETPRLKLKAFAKRAAARITRGLDPPIQIGSGFCIGFGEQSASATR
jgi:hypothetical protein